MAQMTLCRYTRPLSLTQWVAVNGYRLSDLTLACWSHHHADAPRKACSGYRRSARYALEFCICPCHGRQE